MYPIFQALAALGVGAYVWEMTQTIRTALWKPQDDPDQTPKYRRSKRLGPNAPQIVPRGE